MDNANFGETIPIHEERLNTLLHPERQAAAAMKRCI
jgi:hypothetical protein